MIPRRRCAQPLTIRHHGALPRLCRFLALLLVLGATHLSGAQTPPAGTGTAPDPGTQHLGDAVAHLNLIQERLTSALTASHPAAEISSLRQNLFDAENVVLELRYTPLMKSLLTATFANDLPGFKALCTAGMSGFMTAPILGSSHGFLVAAVPDQVYTLRYSGSYHQGGATCLFYVLRPASSGNDLTFLLTVDDDKCSGLEMH